MFLSPFQGLRLVDVYPGLAPWAALFRRFAAEVRMSFNSSSWYEF